MMFKVQLPVLLTLSHASIMFGNEQTYRFSPEDGETTTVDTQPPSSGIREDRQKICNHSDTCLLLNHVPPYRDKRTRNCMCDENCTSYNDCCKDSEFRTSQTIQHNFSCEKTAADGYVYMKTVCPSSSNASETIRKNCEDPDPLLLIQDVWILTPVTNVETGVTYRNMFCAFCNGESTFEFWQLWLSCKDQNTGEQLSDERILPDLIYVESGFWEYVADNTTYECLYHGKVDEDAQFLRYCVPAVVDTCYWNWTGPSNCSHYTSYVYAGDRVYKNLDCLACNNVSETSTCNLPSFESKTKLLTEEVPFISQNKFINWSHCAEIPEHFPMYKKICYTEVREKWEECPDESDKCPFEKSYHINDSDIEFVNDTMYIKSMDLKLERSEYRYINSSYEYVHVCKSSITPTKFQQFVDNLDEWISKILIKLSIISLVAHLLIFQQLWKLRNLFRQNLATYSFMLLVTFLCFEIGPKLPNCEIVAVIMHFSLLSCFMWMLIMSFDYWQSQCQLTRGRMPPIPGSKHMRKFIIYCIIVCVVPLLVVGVALFFELSSPSVVPCDKKLGYGKNNQCFISKKFGFEVFFVVPASLVFLCNILFFAHSSRMIFVNLQNSAVFVNQLSTVIPNATPNDWKLYTRLAVMMGHTGTVNYWLLFTDNRFGHLLFTILNMSQGIFIFVNFTFRQETLKLLRIKHSNNPRVLRLLSMAFGKENVSYSIRLNSMLMRNDQCSQNLQ